MATDPYQELDDKLSRLIKLQEENNRQIAGLRREINKLKHKTSTPFPLAEEEQNYEPVTGKDVSEPSATKGKAEKSGIKQKRNIEEFIGGNIINKAGILILLLGVAIFANYAIENEWINHTTRIILSYLSGGILLLIAWRIYKNYHNFSAVLFSGGLAIFYFTTYIAYSFYHFMGMWPVFLLMVLFTSVTVMAAIKYNTQIIGIFGLAGAYGIPFLLGISSRQPALMFIYTGIINLGILVLAFKKYWKLLNYFAFGLTWLIFEVWFLTTYDYPADRHTALLAISAFFLLFYLSVLAYKLVRKEIYNSGDIVIILLNSFLFYASGIRVFRMIDHGEYMGLFTIVNAFIHTAVVLLIYYNRNTDKNLRLLITGLALAFITLSIPVELSGKWITVLWALETAVLFYVGTVRQVSFYKWIGIALSILTVISIIIDWIDGYGLFYSGQPVAGNPFLNYYFLNSLFTIAALGTSLYFIRQNDRIDESGDNLKELSVIVLTGIFLIVTWMSLRLEISNLYQHRISELAHNESGLKELLRVKQSVWLFNYSALFVAITLLINIYFIKSVKLAATMLLAALILTAGYLLFKLSDLNSVSLVVHPAVNHEMRIKVNLQFTRYISYAFLGFLLYTTNRSLFTLKTGQTLKKWSILLMHAIVLILLSNELVYLFSAGHSGNVVIKTGISILWGVYSFFLILLGFRRKRKILRLAGIFLFLVTLVKLFIFDLMNISTLGKMIVFIALGVLLLIISFVYQKFKNIILMDDQEPEEKKEISEVID